MIDVNEVNASARGGTELLIDELGARISPELHRRIQLIPGRFRGIKPDLNPVFWIHDLPGDPEVEVLANGGYDKFAKLVFVSYWQKQKFIDYYGIPHSSCKVIKNAVPSTPRLLSNLAADDTINLIYHTTPHRGLNVLWPVFKALYDQDNNITLKVFSSFNIYGWPTRDKPYFSMFEEMKNHPGCQYFGTKSYGEVREEISKCHFFVYPSTWQETSCRCLMEAMMGGALPIHSDLACLPETASGLTDMYDFSEDQDVHESRLFIELRKQIAVARSDTVSFNDRRRDMQKRADSLYSWNYRAREWEDFFKKV